MLEFYFNLFLSACDFFRENLLVVLCCFIVGGCFGLVRTLLSHLN